MSTLLKIAPTPRKTVVIPPESSNMYQTPAVVVASPYIDNFTLPEGWCETRLKSGMTLSSLAAQYNTSAEAIVAANGVLWEIEAINLWVIDVGGTWLSQVDGQEPVPGSPTGGWAVFTDRSQINLPCSKNGAPATDCGCSDKKDGYSWGAFFVGLAVGGATAAALSDGKKKKR